MRHLLATHGKVTLEAEINKTGAVFLHVNPDPSLKWTKNLYKEWLHIWSQVIDQMKELGISEVFSLIPKDDPKVNKFQGVFGLTPLVEFEDVTLYRMVI